MALAVALAALGATLVLDAQATLAQKRAEALACEARTEGLSRLSCMDVSDIDAGIQLYSGAAVLLAALAFGAVAAWLALTRERTRAPGAWWGASAAAGSLAALVGWTIGATGIVTSFLATTMLVLGVAALATAAVAVQASADRAA